MSDTVQTAVVNIFCRRTYRSDCETASSSAGEFAIALSVNVTSVHLVSPDKAGQREARSHAVNSSCSRRRLASICG